MLFPPHSIRAQSEQIVRDLREQKITRAEAAERFIALDPDYGGGYALLAEARQDEGAMEEAEALLWKALEKGPCSTGTFYLLASVCRKRHDSTTALELSMLGAWTLALGDEVPEEVAENFRELFAESSLDFTHPNSYGAIAQGIQEKLEAMDPRPEPDPRLKPIHLLTEVHRESELGMEQGTLDQILADPAACTPVFLAALREWGRRSRGLSFDAVCLVTAILGEIGGPDALEELFELLNYGVLDVSVHATWAVWRLGQRFPAETLAAMRAARSSAHVTRRCAFAEQMMELPAGTPGIHKGLMELLDGFTGFAKEEDAPLLVLAVAEALRRHGMKREARDVRARYEDLLPKTGRKWMKKVLESEEGFVPHMDYNGAPEFDIVEICTRLELMEAEDEEDDDEDEEFVGRPRPGRNDPCWCGSGKKYKKCHLEEDEAAGRGEDLPEDASEGDRLVGKVFNDIVECATEWHNLKELSEANRLYFDRSPEEIDADEAAEGGFLPWFVLSFRSPLTGRTLIEEYLRRRGPRLPERERLLVESWRDLRFGLWEVQRIEKGQGLELKNLFDDESMFVADVTSSHNSAVWDCIIERVHFFEGRWQFAADGYLVPRPLLPKVRELVEEGAREVGVSAAEWVRANSHIWERTLERLHRESMRDLRIVNAEGDLLEFAAASYEVLDAPALVDGLQKTAMFEETTSEESAPGTRQFGWMEVVKEGPRRSYGHLAMEDGKLRLECNSRKRLAIGRQLLEKYAGESIRHIEDTFKSVENAIAAGPPPSEAREAGGIPPEMQREIILQMKAKHYATWADEPLPALNGKTPREASRSEVGRRALEDLLRYMENGEERGREAGQPAFDFSEIRKNLGM